MRLLVCFLPGALKSYASALRENTVQPMPTKKSSRGRISGIFTDIHFWVPAAVLLAGLLLLRFIH